MPEVMLYGDLHPLSQGGEGKEGVPCSQASPVGCLRSPGPAAAGCAGEGAAGPPHAGAAGCSVTQTCRMSVGSRPSSQMLCKGSSSA